MQNRLLRHVLTLTLVFLSSLMALAQGTVWAPNISGMQINRFIGGQQVETYFLTRDDPSKNTFTVDHSYGGTQRKGSAGIIDVINDQIRMNINTTTLMGTYWFNGTLNPAERQIINGTVEYGRLGTFTATYSTY